ncbi:MAG: DNA-protecting protein DprA [Coriobacteriia bacterium]|nr:DNA-protecting protein DprA [Coriobacteriia bacterium]
MAERFEVSVDEEAFPSHLRKFEWCPQVLYGRGNVAALRRGVGIIGARKATPYGIRAAEQVAEWCAQLDVPVYSGAAIGCDQAAHKGALKAGGTTIAVLGCGADICYPRSAHDLLDSIADSGCILSPFEWGKRPKKYTFIERNRLIVAFSYLLVVVEGRMPSGTFSAVNWAEQLNVDIAIVPGSIFSSESGGPHYLLSNGAMPLCSKENLIDALTLTIDYEETPDGFRENDHKEEIRRAALSQDEKALLEKLERMPLSVDELAKASRIATVAVIVTINMLEIKGFIQRLPDGRLVAIG